MSDSVQFRHLFTYSSSDADHVDEVPRSFPCVASEVVLQVTFPHPIYLTAFQVGTLRGDARVRVYARDALCQSGARLVPLFDGVLSGQSGQRVDLPKTVSDHVLLRGSFESLEIALMGRSYVHLIEDTSESVRMGMQKCEMKDGDLPFQQKLTLPFVEGFPKSVSTLLSKIAKGEEMHASDTQMIFKAADTLCNQLGLTQTNPENLTKCTLSIHIPFLPQFKVSRGWSGIV